MKAEKLKAKTARSAVKMTAATPVFLDMDIGSAVLADSEHNRKKSGDNIQLAVGTTVFRKGHRVPFLQYVLLGNTTR